MAIRQHYITTISSSYLSPAAKECDLGRQSLFIKGVLYSFILLIWFVILAFSMNWIVGILIVVVLAGLYGWLYYFTHQKKDIKCLNLDMQWLREQGIEVNSVSDYLEIRREIQKLRWEELNNRMNNPQGNIYKYLHK